jgi:hypothetical protein
LVAPANREGQRCGRLPVGDGTSDLVGLKLVPEENGAGTIERTLVELDGVTSGP